MKRIVIDQTLCNGCGECVKQCAQEKSASCCHLEQRKDNTYVMLFCRSCTQPDCLDTCMSGAITRDVSCGNLRYDQTRCASCYMCVMACPYGVPTPRPNGGVARCDLCYERVGGPACIAACKQGALSLEEVSDG